MPSSKNDSELDELVSDLKDLKDELRTARTERHLATVEAAALKGEMNQRLSEVAQLKKLVTNLQLVSDLEKLLLLLFSIVFWILE